MKIEKFKVLLLLKKSEPDKSGKAPIMGRITLNRTVAQFSTKLSCTPQLWNVRENPMIIAAFYLREPVTGKKLAGVFLGALGALLLIVSGQQNAAGNSNIWGESLFLEAV